MKKKNKNKIKLISFIFGVALMIYALFYINELNPLAVALIEVFGILIAAISITSLSSGKPGKGIMFPYFVFFK